MKYSVTRFKSLKLCIKELEPFIRNGKHLQTGKLFRQFGNLRSREILANWLLCVVINSEEKFDRVTFTSDPQGGDGIIYDHTAKKAWPTEHVSVTRANGQLDDVESLILKSIENKQNKGGSAYASGKALIVLLNANEAVWFPNKLARRLPKILDFEDVWIVGLQSVVQQQYVYNVTRLDINGCPMWQVCIGKEFDAWEVKRLQ